MALVNQYARQIEDELGPAWLPRLYRERILKMRTRALELCEIVCRPSSRQALQPIGYRLFSQTQGFGEQLHYGLIP